MTFTSSPHTTAFLTLVRGAWTLVGDGVKPDGVSYDARNRLVEPYAVLYPLGAATFDGSVATGDTQTDVWPVVQITSVGSTRQQAEWLQDRIRTAVAGQALTVAGRVVGPVELDDLQAVMRDNDVTPPLFYAVDRYRTYSTPA